MFRIGAILLLAVELGGGFGNASANVISTTGESMQVELHVEVKTSASSVVVHLALPGEPTITLPLLERESGSYGVTTELRKADYTVVFEALGATSTSSQPVGISELGADIGESSGASTTMDESSSVTEETNAWLWLAIAFAAASLSALAFWVLGARDYASDDQPQTPSDSEASVS